MDLLCSNVLDFDQFPGINQIPSTILIFYCLHFFVLTHLKGMGGRLSSKQNEKICSEVLNLCCLDSYFLVESSN